MSQFEFLMIVGGVVVAIGLTEILSGWGQLIRNVENTDFDILYIGWSVYAVVVVLVYYVGMWPYHDDKFLYLGQIIFLVIPSLFFTLFAYAITPDFKTISFNEYFEKKRKTIYLCLILYISTAALADTVIAGVIFDWQEYLELAAFIGLVCVIAFVEKRWVHIVFVYVLLIAIVPSLFTPLEQILERFL